MYENLAVLGIFVFLYSITCGGLSRTPINGAVVFTLFGFILGPFGFKLLDLNVGAEGLGILAELTLAVVLFTDASNTNLGVLKKNFHIPQRLLLIGLPLTILLGFGVGVFIFKGDLSLLEVAVLATMLAPTDAALGKAVVSNSSVPANIREGLNVESGLNDGICVPILFLFLALAVSKEHTPLLAFKLIAEQIGIGAAVGIVLTLIAAWLYRPFNRLGWVTETWRQVPVIALAISCFSIAQQLGGSGFIASFVGGLTFASIAKRQKHELLLAAEGFGDLMALITWVIFGVCIVGRIGDVFSWQAVIYAALSLTVIRMLPVFITLKGMNLTTDEKLFIGWFGPRGMASVVFAVIVSNKHLEGERMVIATTAFTVIFSILAHGISANPLIAVLKRRLGHVSEDV